MPVLTPRQVMERHLGQLLTNEKVLAAELKRIEHGLAATRAQIEVERRALSGSSESAADAAGQRAA